MAKAVEAVASEKVLRYWARLPYWTVDEAVKLSFGINPAGFSFEYEELIGIEPQFANAFAARILSLSRTFIDNNVEPIRFVDWAREFPADLPRVLLDEILRNRQTTGEGEVNRYNHLLKITLGLAMGGYGYNPASRQDEVIKEILRDLEDFGLKVHQQTLRTKLNEAAEADRASRVGRQFGAAFPGVVRNTTDMLFKDLWLRPDLAPRDRSLVTVSALIATGQAAQMPYHLNRAMDNGLTQAEAAEVLAHLAFYTGWPFVFSAMPAAKEVFDKRPTAN